MFSGLSRCRLKNFFGAMEDKDNVVPVYSCASCGSSDDLCDISQIDEEAMIPYTELFEKCFNLNFKVQAVSWIPKYICISCINSLRTANTLKAHLIENYTSRFKIENTAEDEGEQPEPSTVEKVVSPALLQTETAGKSAAKSDEDYKTEFLDEGILTEEAAALLLRRSSSTSESDPSDEEESENNDVDGDLVVQTLDDTICIYCEKQLTTDLEARNHVRMTHGLDPKTGEPLKECPLCDVPITDIQDHFYRCHPHPVEDKRLYQCHFCSNVSKSRKACFTHMWIKHGVKLHIDQTPSNKAPRARVHCSLCERDFSQKQILNKHLLKAHNIEVQKRKAFSCPLCTERVSYGAHFSSHLLHTHGVHQEIAELEFTCSDEFLAYKTAVQDETKHRFRKVSASRPVVEGLRSNYMCSQSGVYVYQGKGKRPAPERQIYKTGNACPAHMIVTESANKVTVTFYQTHVGHGPCPYYEAREPKKTKTVKQSTGPPMIMMEDEVVSETDMKEEDDEMTGALAWICDTCGMGFLQVEQFKEHISSHNTKLCRCQYCDSVFTDIEAWTHHIQQHTDNIYTMN